MLKYNPRTSYQFFYSTFDSVLKFSLVIKFDVLFSSYDGLLLLSVCIYVMSFLQVLINHKQQMFELILKQMGPIWVSSHEEESFLLVNVVGISTHAFY